MYFVVTISDCAKMQRHNKESLEFLNKHSVIVYIILSDIP